MTLTAADLRARAPSRRRRPRRIRAQALFDARVLLRNGEQLLLTIVLPVLLLVGLTLASVPDLGAGRRIDVVAPGVLALAVLSTAFTGQAIATAFDRRYGVLRLLGTTPLGRSGLLAGRVLAVLVVEAVQVVVLGVVAAGRSAGGRTRSGCCCGRSSRLAGTAAFVALGLLLAGTLRSEAVLAAANLLWVLLVALGGVVVPVSGALGRVAARAALGRARQRLPGGPPGRPARPRRSRGSPRRGRWRPAGGRPLVPLGVSRITCARSASGSGRGAEAGVTARSTPPQELPCALCAPSPPPEPWRPPSVWPSRHRRTRPARPRSRSCTASPA